MASRSEIIEQHEAFEKALGRLVGDMSTIELVVSQSMAVMIGGKQDFSMAVIAQLSVATKLNLLGAMITDSLRESAAKEIVQDLFARLQTIRVLGTLEG